MSYFLLIFLVVYGGMNAYFLWKLLAAAPWGRWGAVPGVVVIVMVAAPLFVRFCENAGREGLARVLAYSSYGWMGIVFLFCTMALLVDFLRLVDRVVFNDIFPLSPAISFILPLMCAFLVAAYGLVEAGRIRVETLVVTSPRIPEDAGDVRIVQVSDIHLGLMVRERRLERILETVRSASPDIVVATGDVVDGQLTGDGTLREMLRGVAPRFGKFAVTGNHEFYARLPQALDFLEKSGFAVLRGRSARPLPFLRIAGVDDAVAKRFGGSATESATLGAPAADAFTLLLKHRPEVRADVAPHVDLQLSGHVHHGQIFPFVLVTRLFYPVPTGLSRTAGGFLYVSRGTGTWGPPMRVLAPPEVTVIILRHGDRLSASHGR